MIKREQASHDRVSGDFPCFHDLRSVPLFCDALGLVKPDRTRERVGKTLFAQIMEYVMENIRTDYRSS